MDNSAQHSLNLQFFQAAWQVNALGEAISRWQSVGGAGPFFVVPHFVAHHHHRGHEVQIDYSIALAQAGPLQIELVQLHSSDRSVYGETGQDDWEGLHHLGSLVDDFDTAVENYTRQGVCLAAEHSGAARVGYLDTRRELGHFTEIIQRSELIISMFAKIKEAAVNWNGEIPVRDIDGNAFSLVGL